MSTAARTKQKPVLFVTGHAPAYRTKAFMALHESENVEFALFGGRLRHGGGGTPAELPYPHRRVREHAVYELAASGRYRAVVCSTGGRIALPAAWAGARRGRVPLILWASLWAHPRTPAHAASYPALRRLYRSADAVVTYGPHVSAYVRRYGASNVHVAPQAVDNAFWGSGATSPPQHPDWPNDANVKFVFAGRAAREKGLGVLFEAWSMSGLQAPTAALVLVGTGPTPPWVPAGGAVGLGSLPTSELRDVYAAADTLVVPSIATRSFREPWGLVVNEAMNQALPVISSDAVGAAAGGLVRDGRNGLIVPAGDAIALAAAMRRLAVDSDLRARLGAAGRQDVAAYDFAGWAAGFTRALASLDISGEGVR